MRKSIETINAQSNKLKAISQQILALEKARMIYDLEDYFTEDGAEMIYKELSELSAVLNDNYSDLYTTTYLR